MDITLKRIKSGAGLPPLEEKDKRNDFFGDNRMIKYICDKCGKEIDKFLLADCMIMSVTGRYARYDKSEIVLCENCKEKFNNWIGDINE